MKNKNLYPWVVVALLWVVALLNYMDRQMLSTMQEAMKVDIVELNKAEAFGALMAIFLWIYGFMSPVAGMIADRFSRKWLVVGSLFVWSAVTYLMGYADNFHELYWLRAVMGISEALYIPSALSLIADWHQGKSRSLAIGIHMTGLYVGQAIGGFGATVAAIFSWHSTFHWFGIIGIVYSLILVVTLRENPAHALIKETPIASGEKKPSLFSGLSVLFSTWAFWIILFYFAAPWYYEYDRCICRCRRYRVIRKMDRWRKLGTRICHAQYYSTGSVGFATLLSSSSDRQYGIIITLMILRNKKYGKDYWFD